MTQDEKANADIFHIIRRGSLEAILALGCIRSADLSPAHPSAKIWNDSFTRKREQIRVPLPARPTLSSFVSFFGTPKPPGLYNLITNYGADHQLYNRDILLLRSSVQRLLDNLVPMVFSDRLPVDSDAVFNAGIYGIDLFDWLVIRSGDFSAKTDPDRKTKASAEVLAFREVPLDAIAEIICSEGEDEICRTIKAAQISTSFDVRRSPRHFFSRGG